MTAAVSFRVQRGSIARIVRGFENKPRETAQRMKGALQDWGLSWQGKMLDRFRGAEGGLHTRTGALKRSLTPNVTGSDLGDLKLRLTSSGVNYARIQEYGGEIKPRNARFLAIPLEANKTAAGVARYPSPRAFIAAHPGETFFLRKNGKLLLMWKSPTAAARKSAGAGKGEAVALWLLVRKVELSGPRAPTKNGPSRLGFFDTWKLLDRERRVSLQKIAREMRRLT